MMSDSAAVERSGTAGDAASSGGSLLPAAGGRYARDSLALGDGGEADSVVSAPLAGGGFVLAWIDPASGRATLKAQLLDSAGTPQGAAFEVGTDDGSLDLHPSVVGLTGGGFAIAWAIEANAGTGDGSGRTVVAQAFDSAGARVGAETLVNTSAAGDQHNPRVAALASGGYAVAWDDAGGKAVRAQLFGADGSKSGAEITLVSASGAAPAVTDFALLADGRLLAIYEIASGTDTILKGQIIGADGALAGPAFELDPLRGSESDAAIAPLETGGFLLAWTRAAGDSSGSGVFAARYDAAGAIVGVPFPVNTNIDGEQTNAAVRALPEGGFIVTWTSAATGASTGELCAQLLDAAGDKVGAEFRVASGALPLSGSIAVLADGGFAIAYDAGGAAAQLFTPATHADIELSLSRSLLSEASSANIAFATIAPAAGASVGAAYTYAIVSDSSGGAFGLNGNKLYVVDSTKLDYEAQPNLTLTVRVTDDSGQIVDRLLSLQLTDAAGAEMRYSAGPQFSLSPSPGTQFGSSQAALAGGGFVAVWAGSDGSAFGARAQLFDGAGNRLGAEIAVNAAPAGNQSNVRVAPLGTGFVVSWTDSVGDSSAGGVKAQIFDSAGTKVGAEFLVNTITAAAQNGADIEALAGGGFVVAWTDASATGGDTDLTAVRAQLFGAAGAKVGGEILVNTTVAGEQFGASVAALAGGGFVISWTDRGGSLVDTESSTLHAQIFDSAGAKVGEEILVPTQTAGIQAVSSVVALASGNFVVAWHSNANGTDFSIKAQMFGPSGARIGGEFSAETTTAGDQGSVVATALPDGGFALSWDDFGGSTVAGRAATVVQLFDAAANKVGDEFVANPLASGAAQRSSGLTALASGDLVASWTDGFRVYGRIFEAGGAPAPAARDSYATDETRAIWGRISHAGDGTVTEVNGVAAAVGERIILPSGAALVLRGDGSFAYDPNGAFGHLVAAAPTGFHHMVYATSATDSFTYKAGGVVHEATVTIAGVKSDDDTYYGSGLGWGSGDDVMLGTAGSERMIGGTGGDSYTVNHVDDVVVELPGEGTDWVLTGLLYYKLPENVENLNYTGSDNATLVGNALNNYLSGGPRSDLFYGGGGNDVFGMWGGSDTAIGGSGNDLFNLETGFYGNGTALQTIVGGGGNDLLRMQARDAFPTGILLTHGGPALAGYSLPNGSFLTLTERIDATGISNIEILTGRGDTYAKYFLFIHDEFTPAGTTLTIEAPGLFDGESLNILASGNFETDAYLHVTGGRGSDDLTGGTLADVLYGGDGNDRLDGGRGDDTIDGEDGDDSLYATATAANGGTDTVIGGSGTDRLYVDFGRGGPGLRSSVTVPPPGDWPSATSSGWIDDGNGNRVNFSGIEALTVTGSDAADQLAGTSGSDVLDGRGGADSMAGGAGDDRYHVDTLDDSVVELATDFNHTGDEILTALAAYTLPTQVEKLTGTSATGQVLTGHAGYNVITGGIGNDILDGGGGGDWDHLVGGKGNDVYFVDNASDGVVELASEGIDEVRTALATYTLLVNVEKLTGTSATAQTLRGNASSNTIVGGAGDDRLEGLAGGDTLDGGLGADTMLGGTSNDVYYVDNAGDVVTENAGEGTDEIRTSLGSYSLVGTNIENLAATSNANRDFRGNSVNNVLTGGAGNDLLRLNDGGNDSAFGGGGNDILYFGAAFTAADKADGGADRDVLILQGNYALTLSATNLAGIESISLQSGARTTWGDTANNFYDYNLIMADANATGGQQLIVNAQSLRAGEDFTFNGAAETGDGTFLVYGGHGVDTLRGGAGNDVFFFEGARFQSGDTVDGGAGRDAIVISSGSGVNRFEFGDDALTSIESISLNNRFTSDPSQKPSYELVLANGNVASGATLIVNGSSLSDRTQVVSVDGSAVEGNLILLGGFGDDVLTGGDGADRLQGGEGIDVLTGGGGADTFRYASQYDATPQLPDRILDFVSGTDRIDLGAIDADVFAAGNQAFRWIGANAFGGTGAASAGELRAYEHNGDWFVEGDMDGNGAADLVIQLTAPVAAIVEGDFLL